MIRPALLLLSSLTLLSPALAAPKLAGSWRTPFGAIQLKQKDAEVTAVLSSATKGCQLKGKQEVLNGVLLEDNLTGEITVCQTGPGCAPTAKAFVILLVSKNNQLMTGALHLPSAACEVPGMGSKRGLRITRGGAGKPKPKPRPKPQPKPEGEVDPTPDPESDWGSIAPGDAKAAQVAQQLLVAGGDLLNGGNAEDARGKFVAAAKADPSRAEAFNGVGITYYARQKYTEALRWYKKALEVNPDFGDSFYNMACIYSIENKKELALKYLKIALLNGYAHLNDPEQIVEDIDFQNIKDAPEFRALIDEAKALK